MKAKSKLFTVIITMVAAIAIMGVGVWASSSQTFRLTVQNDIDVRIDSVVADVWGDYAVYTETQAVGQELKMQKRTAKDDGTGKLTVDASNTNATLLYASLLNGYNDGNTIRYNEDADISTNASDVWKDAFIPGHDYNAGKYTLIGASGLGKFLNGANLQCLDSGNTNTSTETTDLDKGNYVNIDFNTTYAQIVYMYTIRQYHTPGTSNNIYLTVQDEVTDAFAQKISKADGNARVQRNYYITNDAGANAWLPLNAGVTAYSLAATTNSISAANFVTSAPHYLLASPTSTGTRTEETDYIWHIMCVYTFERNSYNLDLTSLEDGIGHNISLLNYEQAKKVYFAGEDFDASKVITLSNNNGNASGVTAAFGTTVNVDGIKKPTITHYGKTTAENSNTTANNQAMDYTKTVKIKVAQGFTLPDRGEAAGPESTGRLDVTRDNYDKTGAFGDGTAPFEPAELATSCLSVFVPVPTNNEESQFYAFRFENMINNGTTGKTPRGIDNYDFYDKNGYQGSAFSFT